MDFQECLSLYDMLDDMLDSYFHHCSPKAKGVILRWTHRCRERRPRGWEGL